MEEAILLLMILLGKFNLMRTVRNLSVMHHLTFALAMSGQLIPLAESTQTNSEGWRGF
jgi:ATP-dependent RNA helicase DHX36